MRDANNANQTILSGPAQATVCKVKAFRKHMVYNMQPCCLRHCRRRSALGMRHFTTGKLHQVLVFLSLVQHGASATPLDPIVLLFRLGQADLHICKTLSATSATKTSGWGDKMFQSRQPGSTVRVLWNGIECFEAEDSGTPASTPAPQRQTLACLIARGCAEKPESVTARSCSIHPLLSGTGEENIDIR